MPTAGLGTEDSGTLTRVVHRETAHAEARVGVADAIDVAHDGRRLAYQPFATGTVNVHDLTTGTDRPVTSADGCGGAPAISRDGSLVAYLVQAGVDAYGVEPDDDTALEGAGRSLDIRADELVAHLKLLDGGSLAAVTSIH